jgi:hypothetical protein
MYKAPAVRGSWASRGMDAWYLGPSADHYPCNVYYVPEMREYRISGSAKLFPQHCQVPNLSANAHLKALTEELIRTTATSAKTTNRRCLVKSLATAIKAILTPTNAEEQRVATDNSIEIPATATSSLSAPRELPFPIRLEFVYVSRYHTYN